MFIGYSEAELFLRNCEDAVILTHRNPDGDCIGAGFGLKDNQTMLRRITEDDEQVTSGALNITLNVAADYQFSRLVGMKFYYNHTINRPKNKNQYNNMNFETGIELQLMLSQ